MVDSSMPQAEIITPAMKDLLGVESAPVTFDVEKGHVRRFAEAVGDLNPLYIDEGEASKTRYGSIIAAPTFFRSMLVEPPDIDIAKETGMENKLDGGSEWEFFESVRPGDRISATARFSDFTAREGRMGTMLYVSVDNTYRNQLGATVATQRMTRIIY
jgi:acyl dehydratase